MVLVVQECSPLYCESVLASTVWSVDACKGLSGSPAIYAHMNVPDVYLVLSSGFYVCVRIHRVWVYDQFLPA